MKSRQRWAAWWCVLALGLCVGGQQAAAGETGTSVTKTAQKQYAPGPVRLHVGLSGTRYAEATGPKGELFFHYQFFRHFNFHVGGRTSLMWADAREQNPEDSLAISIIVGLGLSTGATLDGWELHGAVRFAHVHLATLDSWAKTPLENIIADSKGGVVHRSGAEVALGVIGPQITRLGTLGLFWGADLTLAILPNSKMTFWSTGVHVYLGLRNLI